MTIAAVAGGVVVWATRSRGAGPTPDAQTVQILDGGIARVAEKTRSLGGDRDPAQVGKPPPPARSGSKAQSVTAGDAMTIHAPQHALDRDRDLVLTRLDPPAIQGRAAPYDNMFIFDGYAFDAGLRPGEVIPGAFEIEYDLARTRIPPELYSDVRIFRLGDDPDDRQLLASRVDGSKLIAQSNRNSAIGLGIVLGGVYLYALHHKDSQAIEEAFGTDAYLCAADKTLTRYTICWPKDLGFGDPDALRKLWTQEVAIYQEHDAIPPTYDPTADIDDAIKTVTVYSPTAVASRHLRTTGVNAEAALGKVWMTSAYWALSHRLTSEWRDSHVLPRQVTLTMKVARLADTYLYTTRGFLPPSSVEIYISRKESDLGSSTNPALKNPYMRVKVLPPDVVDAPDQPPGKAIVDDYLVTFTHELFHVTQSARYLLGVDWASHNWFWEATATVLENEAAEAYKQVGSIAKTYATARHAYDESYTRPLGLTSYWGDLKNSSTARQNQGYMMGYFLIYLRDHCAAVKGQGPAYLKRLLDAFKGSVQQPIYTIIEQTTNSSEMMELELERYLRANAGTIASRFSTTAKDPAGVFRAWTTEQDHVLDAANPVVELTPIKNPMASPIRPLSYRIDRSKYDKKADATLVVVRGDDPMQNNQDLALQVGGADFRFRTFTEPRIQAFPDVGLDGFGWIQEIHLYSDGWLNDFTKPYTVFLMLQPDAPTVSIKDGKLVIALPALSPLATKGLVDQFMVTVKDSKNALLMLVTDQRTIELKVGPSGGLTDLDDPAIKKMAAMGVTKYFATHPEEKAALEAKYGATAVAKISKGLETMNLDLGTLNRAAEVLASAAGGAAASGEIAVTIQELTVGEKPIYGPPSDAARQVVAAQPTAGVNIVGTWVGDVQLSNIQATLVISAGSNGYTYTIVNSMYGSEMNFYGRDNKNGTVDIVMAMPGTKLTGSEKAFTTLIKNSDNELYLAAPPTTLRRKK